MVKKLQAWLLEWPQQPLALAQCEVVEIIEAPEIHRTPLGPPWCRALVYWRERFLPLALAEETPLAGLIVIAVAYQTAPCTPLQFAALPAHGLPRQIDVPGDADCEPEQGTPLGAHVLRACFRYEGRTLAVPELSALFAPDAHCA